MATRSVRVAGARTTRPAWQMGWTRAGVLGGAILAAMTVALLAMGRSAACACGSVALWADVRGPQGSQQVADAFSFVHVLLGVLVYAALWFGWRRAPVAARLLVAVGLAAAWEVVENSAWVIHRYREATIAAAYTGDSILNSSADVAFGVLGFAIAWRAPRSLSALGVVVTEALLGVLVRDGLLLNLIMLLYPIEAIRRWQLGG